MTPLVAKRARSSMMIYSTLTSRIWDRYWYYMKPQPIKKMALGSRVLTNSTSSDNAIIKEATVIKMMRNASHFSSLFLRRKIVPYTRNEMGPKIMPMK